MKEGHIIRFPDDGKQTRGCFTLDKEQCDTLERAWKNNEPMVSCIPITRGKPYLCKWTHSAHLSLLSLQHWLIKNPSLTEKDAPKEVKEVWTYEVTGVPGRSGVRIHILNYYTQSEGCMGFGMGFSDLNKDGEVDLLNSGHTLGAFEEYMNKEDFLLHIQ